MTSWPCFKVKSRGQIMSSSSIIATPTWMLSDGTHKTVSLSNFFLCITTYCVWILICNYSLISCPTELQGHNAHQAQYLGPHLPQYRTPIANQIFIHFQKNVLYIFSLKSFFFFFNVLGYTQFALRGMDGVVAQSIHITSWKTYNFSYSPSAFSLVCGAFSSASG